MDFGHYMPDGITYFLLDNDYSTMHLRPQLAFSLLDIVAQMYILAKYLSIGFDNGLSFIP